MMQALLDVSDLSQAALWQGFLVFLRVGAAMALLPAFGEQSVPRTVRLALTFAFALVVGPAVVTNLPLVNMKTIVGDLACEVGVGLILGMFIRFFIVVLQVAGTIAAQSTSLSQLFAGAGVEPLPAIGHLLVVSGLALAVMSGLHIRLAEYLILSYEIFPAGQIPRPSLVAEVGLERIADAFALAFTLAAPFVVASLLYNVALGVINRAMPQLMVAFVGAPVITAGGMLMLLLTAPILLSLWIEALNGFLANPVGGVR